MLRVLQEPARSRVHRGDLRRVRHLHRRSPWGGLARHRGRAREHPGAQDHELHRAAVQGGVEALRPQHRSTYSAVPRHDDPGAEDAEAREEIDAHGSLSHGVRYFYFHVWLAGTGTF